MTSDRADKSDLGDETPRGRDPGEPAVAAKERESVLAENAEEIRALGKRAARDLIEVGRRLCEVRKICSPGNWLKWLQREFGWTDRQAPNYMRVYKLSLKSENFSDLGIPASGLYLLAAPSTPPEVVDEVIERAKCGARLAHAEIKAKIDKIKREKATAAGIKPKKRSEAQGPTAPEQETLLAEEWTKIMWEVASYVLERDGRLDPNDNKWMLLVGRARSTFKALFSAGCRGTPHRSEAMNARGKLARTGQRQRLAHRGFANKLGGCRRECGTRICQDPAPLHAASSLCQ